MKKITDLILISLITTVTLLIGGCDFVILNPEGEVGLRTRDTILITTGLMLLVVIPTILLIIWVTYKYRRGQKSDYQPEWEHSNTIEFWAWGVPIIIIAILAVITYFSSFSNDPRTPIKSDKEPITIQVIALDWKWLFIYPEQGVATINEIAVPVDTPIEFLITSNSVMNSFFIPKLGGQLYAMAGMENRLNLIANKQGSYEGISANYSGFGFSGMRFKVHSVTDQEFSQWVAKVKTSEKRLDDATFAKLEERTRDNPVEYFGSINVLQFKENIEKFKGVQ